MADIVKKQLKAKINGVNTNVYPYTHIEAVIDDEGNTLQDTLAAINAEIDELASSGEVPDGVAYVDFSGENNGEVVNVEVNADTLNGYTADDFVKSEDLENISVDGMVYVSPDEEGTSSDIVIEGNDYHQHANKDVLDKFGETDKSELLYDGKQVALKASVESVTLNVDNWTGAAIPYIYDLGITEEYDFEMLLSNAMTASELEVIQEAIITGSGNDNLLRAWGKKPTVDLPVIIRKWVS